MVIEMRIVGDVRILDCNGKIRLGEGTTSIRKAVLDALESGTKKIILNFEEISYVDSSGIGALLSAYTSVANAGGRMKLLHLTARIRELLTITKLLTVFEAYDSEKDALASFSAVRS
jgi:anti-sigma B factor antagonist